MKHSFHLSFLFTTLCFYTGLHALTTANDRRETFGKTFFHSRSESKNNAQLYAGLANLITTGYDECSYGVVWATAEIERSFDRSGIGRYLFFNGTDTMKTGTANGPGVDIFANNFLLNDNFNSAITARPHVTNQLININLFSSLDFIYPGLYFLAHVPYLRTEWSIDFKETVSTAGTVIAANTLGNPTSISAPFNSMIEAWNGQATFGQVLQPLRFARVDGKQKASHMADVELGLGYIILNNDCNYFSVNFRTIIPTGNRPQGEFLFEPISGNNHHVQIGGGIFGNFYLWQGCPDELLSIFLSGNIYTSLKSREKRTFDLVNNGIGSRYLMFKRFNSGGYANEIVRGPNILTLDINAWNAIEADVVLSLEYLRQGLIVSGGYNLWGRSRDHIELVGTIPENTFGIAGLTGTSGPNVNTTASLTQINGVNAAIADPTPVFISNADIDIESAAHPGAFSHGLFVHIGYIWDFAMIQPFIGIGSEIEFSGTNRSFKMGHFWFKTGFSF